MSDTATRKAHMMEKLRKAMRAIQNDQKYNWAKESEEINIAASAMMERVQDFIEGNAGEGEIKPLYKNYVGLYLV